MPSLKQIAKEAQLAEATVSRILRNRDQCSPETRQRVMALARQHKYRPNMLVRGMQTGRTKTIGVMLPLGSEYFGHIFQGIHDALVEHDHVPIVLWCYDELAQKKHRAQPSELKQIYRLLDRRVDGVILRPVDDAVSDEYLREVWERDIPLITVDRQLEHTHADFVGNDDREIGRAAAEHLLKLGHEHLGHIAGPDSVTTSRLRREGFESAVADYAMATNERVRCTTAVDPKFGESLAPIRELLGGNDRPTAVFAANDVLAAHIYDVADELNLRIPEDLSVVGCGNLASSAHLRLRLQNLDQNPADVGREAVRILMDRLHGRHDPERPEYHQIDFQAVGGSSTAPPRLVS